MEDQKTLAVFGVFCVILLIGIISEVVQMLRRSAEPYHTEVQNFAVEIEGHYDQEEQHVCVTETYRFFGYSLLMIFDKDIDITMIDGIMKTCKDLSKGYEFGVKDKIKRINNNALEIYIA